MQPDLLSIEELSDPQSYPYALLQLADPSLEMIRQYLQEGTCYVAKLQEEIIGVIVLMPIAPSTIEIKNIAITEAFQQKGFGKQLLHFAERITKQLGNEKLVIGTGNSSIAQLALYQKAGFEIEAIKKNFFLENYHEPIIENGIVCKHLIVLAKYLN